MPGLVAWWKADDVGPNLYDSSGNRNHVTGTTAFTLIPPPPKRPSASGFRVGAINTGGVNQIPGASADKTFAAWVNFSGSSNTNAMGINYASGSQLLRSTGGAVQFQDNGTNILSSGVFPAVGFYSHYVYCYRSGTNEIWIDGVLKASNTTAVTSSGAPSTTNCGSSIPGISDARIYARALSPMEIRTLAAGGEIEQIVPRAGIPTFLREVQRPAPWAIWGTFAPTSASLAPPGDLSSPAYVRQLRSQVVSNQDVVPSLTAQALSPWTSDIACHRPRQAMGRGGSADALPAPLATLLAAWVPNSVPPAPRPARGPQLHGSPVVASFPAGWAPDSTVPPRAPARRQDAGGTHAVAGAPTGWAPDQAPLPRIRARMRALEQQQTIAGYSILKPIPWGYEPASPRTRTAPGKGACCALVLPLLTTIPFRLTITSAIDFDPVILSIDIDPIVLSIDIDPVRLFIGGDE